MLRSFKLVSYLWVGAVLGAGCAFLGQVVLARQFDPATFGVFAAALGTVMLVTPLASFGIGAFWLKVYGEEGWQAERWLAPSLRLVLITTSSTFALIIIWAFVGPHDEAFTHVLLLLSIIVFGQVSLELASAKFQLEERYGELAIWQFTPHLLRLGAVLAIVYLIDELTTLTVVSISYAIIALGIVLVGGLSIWRMSNGQLKLRGYGLKSSYYNSGLAVAEVTKHSWPFGLSGVLYLIYFQSDILILKYMDGNEAAGIYNAAFLIMSAVYLLPAVLYQKFLLPKIHRWASHDRVRFRNVYRQGNLVMFALGCMSMICIWILAPVGLPLLFNESYSGALTPLIILAAAAPVRFMATSVGSVLVTKDNMKRKVQLMGFTALVNILMNIALIPVFGVVGAAVSTVVTEVLLLLLYTRSVKRNVFIEEKFI
ncbi:MAG TPA: flippase [Pseudomonas xinjiangensis]|uniref:Flippase n=2 Tax=root TaxID=1 RepID=A0A7V1FT19_9GAMM|nr:flippase [Halopseudomonas xinjiangensis]HEC47467.1 flippase [Halopseudomonas xinjiangensis]